MIKGKRHSPYISLDSNRMIYGINQLLDTEHEMYQYFDAYPILETSF